MTEPKRMVFLVHGRDDRARSALEQLLRAFDLKVIPWRQAATAAGGGSPYTGDIVSKGMEIADAVVVLLTPDDVGHLREEFWQDRDGPDEREPTGQPRMNVIFEAGMAMGRDRNRVVLVEVGAVRRMTDIDGVNVIRLNDDVERRRDLAMRLRAAGLTVDLEDDAWRKAGSFDALREPAVSGGATPARSAPASAAVPASARAARYEEFWRRFFEAAAGDPAAGWIRARSRGGHNWVNLEQREQGSFVIGFASGRRLRTEFYIDVRDAERNELIFALAQARKAQVEAVFGGPLSWEPLKERRACRVATYREGEVKDAAEHDAYVRWFLDTSTRLRAALDGIVK